MVNLANTFALPFDIYEFPVPKIIQFIFTNIYTKNEFSSFIQFDQYFSNFQSHLLVPFRVLSASEAEDTLRINVLKFSLVDFNRGVCKCVHMNLMNDWLQNVWAWYRIMWRLNQKIRRKRRNRRCSGSSSVITTVSFFFL